MKKPHIKLIFIALLLTTGILLSSGCSSGNTGSTAATATTEQIITAEAAQKGTPQQPQPPVAAKKPKELTTLGNTRTDNYYWLNERENPEVISYLEAENKYTAQMLENTEELQQQLYQEIIGRIKQQDESVPFKEDGYWYYTRYEAGKEYPIYARKKGSLEASEQIMVNANERAEGLKYYAAAGMNVSPDNRLLAFGEDTVSRRKYTIRFKDLSTGRLLSDAIPNTTGTAVWANDNKTVFYTMKDPALRSYKIFKHTLGSPAADDKQVYHEADETFSTFVYKTKSDKYLIIGSNSTMANEYRFLDANNPNGTFKVIQPRERGLEYSVDQFDDKFYIVTNKDGATNFKLMQTPVSKPGKANWKDVIPAREDVLLEGIEIF